MYKRQAVGILVGKFPELLFRNLSRLHANSIIDNRLRIVQSPSCLKPYIYPKQIFNYTPENRLFLRIAAALCSKKDKPLSLIHIWSHGRMGEDEEFDVQ